MADVSSAVSTVTKTGDVMFVYFLSLCVLSPRRSVSLLQRLFLATREPPVSLRPHTHTHTSAQGLNEGVCSLLLCLLMGCVCVCEEVVSFIALPPHECCILIFQNLPQTLTCMAAHAWSSSAPKIFAFFMTTEAKWTLMMDIFFMTKAIFDVRLHVCEGETPDKTGGV